MLDNLKLLMYSDVVKTKGTKHGKTFKINI